MDNLKFSVRKSEFEKFAEGLGISPAELLDSLKAEVIKVGPGFRYVIDMENFFYFVLEKLYTPQRKTRSEVSIDEFEEALNKAIAALAGASGYSKLSEVRNYVMRELGIGEEDFEELLTFLLQSKRGSYVLLEGGDVKIQIGGKKYGFIKKVERKNMVDIVYY
ncbi:MAG: hypothetical protein QXR68_07380 [Pyrobaculum sp.]